MHNLTRAAARTEMLIAIILFFTLCLNSGCNNGGQSNSNGFYNPGAGGTPIGGGTILKGTVVDGDSLVPLSNATVTLGTLKTTTDSQGNYSFSGITTGTQALTVTCRDYSDFTEKAQVTDGQTTTQDIAMATTIDDWLDRGAAYSWQVEAVQADGTIVSGPVWNFTTESARGARSLSMTDGIGQDQAEKVAGTFLASRGQGGLSIAAVEKIDSAAGLTLAYAFILNPTGYIIIPASRADVLPPVLAYSFTSSFSTHQAASLPFLNMIRGDVGMRLAALNEKAPVQPSLLAKNREMWNTFLSGKNIATPRAVIGPLLYKPTWGQGDPYNRLCPVDPKTGDSCITGCVATAYGQILNYWQSPTTVTFTSSDNYTTDARSISITASKANFTNLSYNGGYPKDDIMSEICFALGVLARMDYTSTNSTAYTLEVGKSLTRFGYKQPKTKSFGVNDTLDTDPIKTDLKVSPWGYPVALAISKVNDNGNYYSGHAIVCDGYDDSDGTFHLNMGWNSNKDGWYALPSGMPSNYTNVKGYVYGLLPAGKGITAPAGSRATIPENPYPEQGETRVALDDELLWDECDGAVSYNCYLWKSNTSKPATPTFTNLPYAGANPGFLPQK